MQRFKLQQVQAWKGKKETSGLVVKAMIKTIEIKSAKELGMAISKEIKKSRKNPTEILKRAGRNKQYLGRLNNGTAKEVYVSSLIRIFQELGYRCFLVPKKGDGAATIYHITIR